MRATGAFQTWPSSQVHSRTSEENALTRRAAARSTSLTATSGRVVARSLKPGSTFFPAHTGQPWPLVRVFGETAEARRLRQRQATLFSLRAVPLLPRAATTA